LCAVHGIGEAAVLGDSTFRPGKFSLEAYVATGALQFGIGSRFKLEAHVTPTLAALLEETPLSEDQVLEPLADGSRVSASVNDSWQLRWWILGQAESIEIIEPATLREATRDSLASALARYARKD